MISTDYAKPISSDVPVLIFTGEWDPVTPPSNGDAAARQLKNSLHIVVPHGGHGFGGLDGLDCIERLGNQFVESGSVKSLDTACVKSIKRKAWAMPRSS
jgi:pimeloyl-ACP methyl ester carboxylesterase